MWWGRRDALCRISAAALWPGGDAVGGAKELAVSGGPKNGERERARPRPRKWGTVNKMNLRLVEIFVW